MFRTNLFKEIVKLEKKWVDKWLIKGLKYIDEPFFNLSSVVVGFKFTVGRDFKNQEYLNLTLSNFFSS